MARKTPPRDSKGRFVKRSRAKKRRTRRNPVRRHRSPRSLPPRNARGQFVARAGRRSSSSKKRRRRTRAYRSNPRRPDFIGSFTDGMVMAGQVVVGKAAARSVPDLLGLPKQGNVGLAVQAGVALVAGWAADMFLGREASRAIMAGGLTAPLETLIVAYNVPWLSTSLAPVTAQSDVGAYVMGGGGANGFRRNPGRSVQRRPAPARGLGRYAAADSYMFN